MDAALGNSPFMRACRRESVPYTPIWLMRQAGRYMREYREVRARVGFLELCKTPDLAAEVTVTAAERLNVDAAIIFADILLILEPMGIDLEFAKGEGPVIHNPVRSASDVERLREVETVESLDYVFEAIRRTRRALRPDLPLIGFSGAPFTLASYMIEGGGSRNYVHMARDDVSHLSRTHPLSQRADRCGRTGRAAFRLVGRLSQPRRLPRIRTATHTRSHSERHAGCSRLTFRHRHSDAA